MAQLEFDLKEYIDSIPHDKLKEMAIDQEKELQEYRVKLFEVRKAFTILSKKQYDLSISAGANGNPFEVTTFDSQVQKLRKEQAELKLLISEVNGKLFNMRNTQQIIKLNGGQKFVDRLKERALQDKVQADVVERNIKEVYSQIFEAKCKLEQLKADGALETVSHVVAGEV